MLVANTKIDPLFEGQLKICLFNASSRKITIYPDKAFACVFFQTLEYSVPSVRTRIAPTMKPLHRFDLVRYWEQAPKLITSIATLTGGGIVGFLIRFFTSP